MEGFEEDEHGPHVSFDRELLPYLGRQTTLVFDYRDPVLGRGERLLLAIKLKDAGKVTAFLQKVYTGDTDIRHFKKDDAKVWSLKVSVLGGGTADRAYCVTDDYLFCADLDLLEESLARLE